MRVAPGLIVKCVEDGEKPRNLRFCVPLKAKSDKEKEVADFLRFAVPTPNRS